jgi:hypothetical protein
VAGKASLAKKITGSENRDDSLPAEFVDNGEFDTAGLDIQYVLGGIALREDSMFCLKRFYSSAEAG